MNHKEFMDEIISGMMTSNTPEEMTESNNEDINTENTIKLTMSTGETYLIDAGTFDWDSAVNRLPQMLENEASLRNMMFGLLTITDPESDESVEKINNIISQLIQYLEGYGITPNYEMFDENISPYKKAMILLFDVNNISKEMSHNISLYSALKLMSCGGLTADNIDTQSQYESTPPTEYDGVDFDSLKNYRVLAKITEGGLTITSIEEITDDELFKAIGINSGEVFENHGIYTVFVYEPTKENALKTGYEKICKYLSKDVNIYPVESEVRNDSGLLDE